MVLAGVSVLVVLAVLSAPRASFNFELLFPACKPLKSLKMELESAVFRRHRRVAAAPACSKLAIVTTRAV